MLDHPTVICMTVSGRYNIALGRDKVRPAVCCNQPELLEHGVILLQDSAIPHHQCSVQSLVQHWSWKVLEHPPYCPDFAPCNYWFFAHVKEHLRGKLLQVEDEIDTALTASLHHLSEDEFQSHS
jgi:transposase